MLNNASGFRKVYIAAGYTYLRRGIDELASIVKINFQLDSYEKVILFLFCERCNDRIKGLIWEEDVTQVTRRKQKGKRETDLKDLPVEVIPHIISEAKL